MRDIVAIIILTVIVVVGAFGIISKINNEQERNDRLEFMVKRCAGISIVTRDSMFCIKSDAILFHDKWRI